MKRSPTVVATAAAAVALSVAALLAYPRPALAVRTLRHARRPGVDPAAVRASAAGLPDDPNAVREYVRRRLVPFAHDWVVYGVPYYFPTLEEVLAHGRGDCKSQALAIASLLAAKDIPYRLLVSPDHIWVEYEGKMATAMEDPAVAVAEFRDGRWHALRPSRLRLGANARVSVAAYWGAAPRARQVAVAGALLTQAAWAAARVASRSARPTRPRGRRGAPSQLAVRVETGEGVALVCPVSRSLRRS